MYNKYLATVYRSIYGEDFSNGSSKNRLKMQRAVFLLDEHGTSLGDYHFHWFKSGVYSIDLNDDMADIPNARSAEEIKFSDDTLSSINKIRDLINTETDYNLLDWTECLVMLLYLRKHIMSSYLNDDLICNEMSCNCPHLNNTTANKTAMKLLRETFTM